MGHTLTLGGLLVAVVLSSSHLRAATEDEAPASCFGQYEKLSYVVRWGIIRAGTVVFESTAFHDHDGVPRLRFSLTAKTNPFVSRFFNVRHHFESIVDRSLTHSVWYRKNRREGDIHEEIEVVIDAKNAHAQRSKFGETAAPISILPGTFDPLSFFYKFRTLPIRQHDAARIPVTDGYMSTEGRMNVYGVEMVRTRFGRRRTYLASPDPDNSGSIFTIYRDATLNIWFSADDRRIPVKFASAVMIGSFICELVAIESVDESGHNSSQSGGWEQRTSR